MINVISQYQCTYTPEYPATHAPDGTCIAGCPVEIHYDTQEYGFRSREISDIKILKRRNTKGYHRQILIVGYRGLNELVYSQRIKAEQEYLYRIAYFYQGEETAALETIQETVARDFVKERIRRRQRNSIWKSRGFYCSRAVSTRSQTGT